MKKYSDIPRRNVISSPFYDRKITTYGILTHAKSTNRYLLVQGNYSLGMAYLMHGQYRPVHFDKLKYYITKKELNILKNIVFNEDSELYRNHYMVMYGREPPSLYAYGRLLDIKEDILELDIDRCLEDVLFGIPKGRLNPREDTITAAIREFTEETGIQVVKHVNPEPYVYETPGIVGNIYELKCWVYQIEDEMDLTDTEVRNKNEITERLWLSVPKLPESYVEGEFYCDSSSIPGRKIYIDNESVALINKYIKNSK